MFEPYGKVLKRFAGAKQCVSIPCLALPRFPADKNYLHDKHDSELFSKLRMHIIDEYKAVIIDNIDDMLAEEFNDCEYGSYKAIATRNYSLSFSDVQQSFFIKMGNVYENGINNFLKYELGVNFACDTEEKYKLKKAIRVDKLDNFCFFQDWFISGEFKFNIRLDTEKSKSVKERVLAIDNGSKDFTKHRFIFLTSLSFPSLAHMRPKDIVPHLKEITYMIYGWREFFSFFGVWINEDEWCKLAMETYDTARKLFDEKLKEYKKLCRS